MSQQTQKNIASSVTCTEAETPHLDCSTITAITTEHSYTCEPNTFKRKYQGTLHKLEQTQKELLNTKWREKGAKVCIDNLW